MNDTTAIDSKHGVSWEILDGTAMLSLVPREGGDLLVRFDDPDGETIWTGLYQRGFWDLRTQKGEIGNSVAKALPWPKEEVKAELQEVWTELGDNTDEYKRALLAPSVKRLIENTERVELQVDPVSRYDVVVTAELEGEPIDSEMDLDEPVTRTLSFTHTEWLRSGRSKARAGTPPVVGKYKNEFYRTLNISWEQWREDIRPAWERMQEVRAAGNAAGEEAVDQ